MIKIHLSLLSFLLIVGINHVLLFGKSFKGSEEPRLRQSFVNKNDLLVPLGTFDAKALSETNFKILVYDETSGFAHASRGAARTMFTELGDEHGFEVDFDRSGDAFNTLENLQKYAVVVFSNTSGNEILSETQKENFEEYIRGGGSFLGIHAATDTYRTGWDWYRDLVGGSVRANPNHTDQGHPGVLDVLDESHPSTQTLPNPWSRNEEWYYWKGGGGYLYDGNINLLQVRATGDEDYDEARPISWYKEFDGGRSFYTAMGHANNAYEEEHFRAHILGALEWLTEESESPPPSAELAPTLDPIDDPEPVSVNADRQEIILTGIGPGDAEFDDLTITVQSGNPALIPDPEIEYSAPSMTAVLYFQPVEGRHGTALITVTIDNGQEKNNFVTRVFTVTVAPENTTLSISEIEDQVVNINQEIGPLEFAVSVEGQEVDLDITAVSDNPDLIPNENITIEGEGAEKTISLQPEPNRWGTAVISILAASGPSTAVQSFKVEVQNITSVHTPELQNIKIYPVPAIEEINLELPEGSHKIVIYNYQGKTVFPLREYHIAGQAPVTIPLGNYAKGVYTLSVISDKGTVRKKILIQ